MKFENKPELGRGIYTMPDIARILNLDKARVRTALNEYWDKKFAGSLGKKYSWSVGGTKAVSFHTLVEFYVFFQLKEHGAPTREILDAHLELSTIHNTPFPFANYNIINGIRISGKKLIFEFNEGVLINLDGSKQLNLAFIKDFIKKLSFDKNNLAERFFPLGKKVGVVVDPKHKFGLPVISDTNIFPETVYQMYIQKESKEYIAESFGLTQKQVTDAINYCKSAA